MKSLPLALLLVVLAIVPFFWFKPGEVNLGGDSSRLYFYDPVNYLANFPLYNIAPGQSGDVMLSYFFVPFTAMLVLFKTILRSPALLINAFHSFMLVSSFLFVYLTVKELLSVEKRRDPLASWSAIVSGIFYVFAPTVWNWDKAISSHHQLFLNPLIFYLLLRHLRTNRAAPLVVAVLVTFLFAPNFSLIAAPPLFAFYPLSLIFLFLYKIMCIKTPFHWKTITISFVLLLGIHSFQLLPQISSFTDRTGSPFQQAFSAKTSIDGFTYFSSTYKGVKLSKNIAMITSTPLSPHVVEASMYLLFFVVLVGLLTNSQKGLPIAKRRNFLILCLFTMITMFFATANVTNIGVSFYKSLFFLPGFSMFKNFLGQFIYVYSFFYSLTLGYALYIVSVVISRQERYVLFTSTFLILILNGLPFITGRMVNLPILGSKDVRVPFKMDPSFEEVLRYIRAGNVDGKFLTLPLTDYGYQMLSGTDGGLYIGPSTIGYLTGKKDYMGYNTITHFSEAFSDYLTRKDYESIKTLFSWLNIRYIFYNSDPYIYDKFPEFPYSTIKRYFPDHDSVKRFIDYLGAKKIFEIKTYSIYQVPDEAYLPHFYIPQFIVTTALSGKDAIIPISLYPRANRLIAIANTEIQSARDSILQPIKIDSVRMHKISSSGYVTYATYPYAKWKFNSPMYPVIVAKEEYLLRKHGSLSDEKVNKILFYAAKRIVELSRWEKDIKINSDVTAIDTLIRYWKKPKLWEVTRWQEFNSWEVVLSRYASYIQDAVTTINESRGDPDWVIRKKLEVAQILLDHQSVIANIIRFSQRTEDEKQYILGWIDRLFDYFIRKVSIKALDPTVLMYDLDITPNQTGSYQVYLRKDKLSDINIEQSVLQINGQKLRPIGSAEGDEWHPFGSAIIDQSHASFVLDIQRVNIANSVRWQPAGYLQIQSNNENTTGLLSFRPNVSGFDGMMASIKGWKSQTNYILSFDYNTEGSKFEIRLLARQKRERDGGSNEDYGPVFSLVKESDGWSTFYAVVESKNIDDAILLIVPQEDRYKKTKMEIKNLSATEVLLHPDILLKKNLGASSVATIPKIRFRRINPTKYSVQVKNATEPYSLIFSESFHKDWKIYRKGYPAFGSKSTYQTLGKFTGTIAQKIAPWFMKDYIDSGETVATYFDGDIEEGGYSNIFLAPSTFETWGINDIAADGHFVANGYANGWYIRPEDVNGARDYELIVEMSSQRLFYIGSLISFFFLSSAVVYLGIHLRKRMV